MKSITNIKSELKELEQDIRDAETPAKEKTLRKKIPFYRELIMYLESSPSELFVNKQIAELKLKVERRMAYKSDFGYGPTATKLRNKFKKEQGVDILERQIKGLEYIIK